MTIPSSSGVFSKKSCSCWLEKMCEWFLLITECNACSRLEVQPMPEDPKPAQSFRGFQPEAESPEGLYRVNSSKNTSLVFSLSQNSLKSFEIDLQLGLIWGHQNEKKFF